VELLEKRFQERFAGTSKTIKTFHSNKPAGDETKLMLWDLANPKTGLKADVLAHTNTLGAGEGLST
jgi:hypothetical protein